MKWLFKGICKAIRAFFEPDEDWKDKGIEYERNQWGYYNKKEKK